MPYLFEQLNELIEEGKITIGINRNHANNFFYQTTVLGKVLNWITNISLILIIVVFIKFGFFAGIGAIVLTGIHVIVTRKIAIRFMTNELQKSEPLFSAAYMTNSITIRINSTGEILSYPEDWTDFTNHI